MGLGVGELQTKLVWSKGRGEKSVLQFLSLVYMVDKDHICNNSSFDQIVLSGNDIMASLQNKV